jgi:hypothetical protein
MASFEEEGSVVAFSQDLYGCLAAPHHGICDDRLVGMPPARVPTADLADAA